MRTTIFLKEKSKNIRNRFDRMDRKISHNSFKKLLGIKSRKTEVYFLSFLYHRFLHNSSNNKSYHCFYLRKYQKYVVCKSYITFLTYF
ncbi:hypothetical protein AOE56_01775 [Candidatus Riesia pediculicola]|nr:hypothetical protein AOE56_01775 [Candidatus Riesia pediculicola]